MDALWDLLAIAFPGPPWWLWMTVWPEFHPHPLKGVPAAKPDRPGR